MIFPEIYEWPIMVRETKFFELFVEIANNVIEGAESLSDLLSNYDYEQVPAVVSKIIAIEHRGDELTHRILIKLNQTFITPLDRDDIHLLASYLDDVLDSIFSASDALLTYKIIQPPQSAKVLADIILQQAQELGKAIALLDKMPQCCLIASRSLVWNTMQMRLGVKRSDVCLRAKETRSH